MKTGIIFDLDGTLLDTLEDLKDAVNYALAQFDCPGRTAREVCSFVGNGVAKLIERALPGAANDPDPKEVLAVYHTYYNANCQVKTAPYPGILDVLAVLGEKYPLAIVSNKPDVAVKSLCRLHFGDIYARGETADCPRKPAPDMVFQTMEKLGLDSCIYVGDSEVDVITAKNANMPCLTVLWGFRDEDFLRQQGAAHFCHDPKNLATTLKELIEHGQ